MKRVLLILSVTLGSILLVTYLLSYGPIWYANHSAKVWDRTQHRWIQVFNWNRTNSNIQDDLWNAMLKMDPGWFIGLLPFLVALTIIGLLCWQVYRRFRAHRPAAWRARH